MQLTLSEKEQNFLYDSIAKKTRENICEEKTFLWLLEKQMNLSKKWCSAEKKLETHSLKWRSKIASNRSE